MANKKTVKNVKEQNVETLNSKEAFFLKYKKAIIIAVAALVVIIGGYALLKNLYLQPREDTASTELAKCQELFANEQYADALNGNKNGVPGFLKVASEYGSTKAGNLANLYAGLCYANLQKWQEAATSIENYSSGDDQMVSPAAMAALGNVYAHLKNYDKAVDCLKKAASMADAKAPNGLSMAETPYFLLQAGEILEAQNKKDEALKIYQDIKTKYVNSAVSVEVEKYILRLAQ
ncbi:MAG: tetratricopeptide repeat protein [Prevotella sp.]|jgi:tetratricopeptide (TPR) repeat protein|nr:tetratricopeptide repeat protein [Prevotella sp.]